MTTIVYDHKNKQIACDSRMTSGNLIVTDEGVKHVKKENSIYFIAGRIGEGLTFATHFKEMEKANDNLDNDCIFVDNKCAYLGVIDNEKVFRSSDLYYNMSVGSGGDYAICALDFGATAKEAIEYAATKDVYTGGKVHVYDIEKCEFITANTAS